MSNQPSQPSKQQHMAVCPKCGSNSQVWINQLDGRMTCHRVGCQGAGGLSLGPENFPGDEFEPCEHDTGTWFHNLMHRWGLTRGFVDHERDANGEWWVGMRCPTCGRFEHAIKSRFQD